MVEGTKEIRAALTGRNIIVERIDSPEELRRPCAVADDFSESSITR